VAGKKKPNTLGVKAEGKDKLVVTLDKRIPYFKLLMGFPLFFPQNQKAVEQYGKNYGTSSKKVGRAQTFLGNLLRTRRTLSWILSTSAFKRLHQLITTCINQAS
jgi:hypothetical protein